MKTWLGKVLGLCLLFSMPAFAQQKLPEGIALGGILRASMRSRTAAMGWCALAEGATLVGGALGLAMAPHLGTRWITYPLGVTAGTAERTTLTRFRRSGSSAMTRR